MFERDGDDAPEVDALDEAHREAEFDPVALGAPPDAVRKTGRGTHRDGDGGGAAGPRVKAEEVRTLDWRRGWSSEGFNHG